MFHWISHGRSSEGHTMYHWITPRRSSEGHTMFHWITPGRSSEGHTMYHWISLGRSSEGHTRSTESLLEGHLKVIQCSTESLLEGHLRVIHVPLNHVPLNHPWNCSKLVGVCEVFPFLIEYVHRYSWHWRHPIFSAPTIYTDQQSELTCVIITWPYTFTCSCKSRLWHLHVTWGF